MPAPGGDARGDRPPLKVLHVITDSFSANAFVAPLARYQELHGWRTTIACSGRLYADAHAYVDVMRASGLDVRDVRIPRDISPIADLASVFAVRGLIAETGPSIVHTHLAKGGIVGRLAARLAGVPAVHTVYDYAFEDARGMKRRLYVEAERLAARSTKRIFFISANEERISRRERIGSPARLVTMGFGVELARFDPDRISAEERLQARRRLGIPADRVVVGTVARLVPRKQVDKLVALFAELARTRPALHLLVVGGGPLEADLTTLAARLGVSASTTFTGFVDDDGEIPGLYAAMDVFCLLSRREGYGMAVAEAGAMGLPAVALDIPPVNDLVINGETGLLVDEPGAAAAVAKLVDDPALARQMGQAAKRFIRRECNLSDRFQLVLDVYRELIPTSPTSSVS